MHGDHWDARYESYVSDPQTEPDPSGWRTDIPYRLADRAGGPPEARR